MCSLADCALQLQQTQASHGKRAYDHGLTDCVRFQINYYMTPTRVLHCHIHHGEARESRDIHVEDVSCAGLRIGAAAQVAPKFCDDERGACCSSLAQLIKAHG